jgi:predicted metal-dependent phosphoesterase TrpH
MDRHIDLHLHTDISDGARSPEEVLQMVRVRNLAAFAVTDHDNINGYRAVKSLLREGDPELLSGVELSVGGGNGDLHLLVYCFDADDQALNDTLTRFQENRNRRGRLMVQKLNDLGVGITYEDVMVCANGAAVSRPHVAMAMYRKKAVRSYEEAFDLYIGDGKPGYVPKKNLGPVEALALAHRAGGVTVLAHPVIDDAWKQIESLAGLGLDGIEVYHPSHAQGDTERFKSLAERLRLIVTGGSDYHGIEGRYGVIGSQKVPAALLAGLKQRAEQKRKQL